MDELIFSGAFRDWKYSARFDLANANEQDVAAALAQIHGEIEDRAFCYAGIDCDMIENSVPQGKGIPDVIKFLESRKPGEWKGLLLEAAGKKELLPAAEAKFICTLLTKNGVFAKMKSELLRSSIKPQKQELLEGQIALIGRYREWTAIKKMGVDEKTKDYEIAGILSSINTTIMKKAFDFMKPDRSVEAIADAATKGKRKSFVNLSEALKQVAQQLTGDKIRDAYLLKCVFENLGFAPYANVEVLVPAYPDLKTAKPKGRVSKR